MSDMMQRPQARPPMPGATAAPRPNAISQNSSVFNPADAAMMGQQGAISKNMTVGDLITKVLKVPLTAPAGALIGALKTQLGNRNMAGKAQSMTAAPAGNTPVGSAQGPRNGTGPMGAAPSGGGMAELMKQVGGK